jgi:hypothetical protein
MTMSFILPTSPHFPAVSPQVLHGFTKLQLLNGKSRTRTGRQFPSAQSDKLEVERDLSRDRPRRNRVRTTEQGIGPAPNVELENRERSAGSLDPWESLQGRRTANAWFRKIEPGSLQLRLLRAANRSRQRLERPGWNLQWGWRCAPLRNSNRNRPHSGCDDWG